MQYYPFDSRNSLYKSFGALAEGETLRLKVLLHKDAKVNSAYVILKNDTDNKTQEALMKPCEWLEDYRFYQCELALTEGLYWYCFRYTSEYGEFFVSKTETSLGIVINEGKPTFWQQTVYSKDFNTPKWLEGGIIYQIFPDRFSNSGEPKANVPTDRYICEDWYSTPLFLQPENDAKRLGNDYYGGDLKGITLKLDYLHSLGVTCIYLNPIFEAHSNHRYDTADYMKIDPSLGTEADLEELISKAKDMGISIILDGVFSHTGADSRYFNKNQRYGLGGAFNSKESEYYSWYNFKSYPNDFSCWWGVPSLPETNENDLSFSNFITGENGVIRYWLKKGIKGFRLDVADELPDSFLDKIRLSVKAEGEENYLLGEVWEDASNKISYGSRRRFLRGRQLDSVMNYPFANAIVNFLKGGKADKLVNTVLDICENYPKNSVNVLMNHIGTHDTARILTRLGSTNLVEGDRLLQSQSSLSQEEYAKAVTLLRLAAVLQYTLPGVPSIYYGDEAGMTGYGDPFCRKGYPWGKENVELLSFYKSLGKVRRSLDPLKQGDFIPLEVKDHSLCFIRKDSTGMVLVAVNADESLVEFSLPCSQTFKNLLGEKAQADKIVLNPLSFAVISF